MSTAPQGSRPRGEWLPGEWLPARLLQAERLGADRALAARDTRVPALNWLLDDELLSGMLGERVHITRTRYKPGLSVLVSFRRGRGAAAETDSTESDSAEAFGWALTITAEHAGKLYRRAASSRRRGGGIRLVRPFAFDPDVVVAVGPVDEDWPLSANLRWLQEHGLERLGAVPAAPGRFLNTPADVLRYNPGRRLVLRVPSEPGPIVVKTAADPSVGAAGIRLRQRLERHGVPVLPELADPDCAVHGISASPVWGDGDLSDGDNDPAAYRAGIALAAIHRIDAGTGADPAAEAQSLVRQLAATRSMILKLLPGLEVPVDRLTDRLLAEVCTTGSGGQQAVLVHGDFSPDQILVSGSAVRIIDFDRVRTSDPAMDLGSFAAVEEIAAPAETGARAGAEAGGRRTACLIEGYRGAGGHVSPAGVNTWAAYRLFLGSVEPFRSRAGDWPSDTTWHIRRALELIA